MIIAFNFRAMRMFTFKKKCTILGHKEIWNTVIICADACMCDSNQYNFHIGEIVLIDK